MSVRLRKTKLKMSDIKEILPELTSSMSWQIGSNGKKDYLMIVGKNNKVWSKVKIKYPFVNSVTVYVAVGEALLNFDKNRKRMNLEDYSNHMN